MEEKNYELAKELRHELHAHPELSNEEEWTKERLMSFLRDNTSLEIIDKGNWFYAAYRSGEDQPNIAFRADFDALPMDEYINLPWGSEFPGKAHKCGHDGHSATLAGFALEVDQKGSDNNIFFLFQTAEETGDGAKQCLPLIREEKIDKMYGYHNMSGMPYRSVNVMDGNVQCASMGMIIKMKGRPAHASQPEDGLNPSYAIASLINELPTLTENSDGLLLCTIVNVSIGEREFGMSAYYGEVALTIRALYEKELKQLRAHIVDLATRKRRTGRIDVTFEYSDVFPETINDPVVTDDIRNAAKEKGFAVQEMKEALRGSEDYGHYAKEVPATYFFMGNGVDHPPVHTPEYDFIDTHIRDICEIYKGLVKVE